MDAKMQIQQLLVELSFQDKLQLIEQIVKSIGDVEIKEEAKVKEHPILEMAGIWSEETAKKMEENLEDTRKIDHNEW